MEHTPDNSKPSSPQNSAAIPPIILLVEDDADTRDMYSVFFESAGMWVATAPNPRMAMETIAELKPDVVVTDIGFEGQPLGLQFVHAMKAGTSTAHVPVVLLSGLSNDVIPEAARAEVDLCLVKPILPDDLLTHIKRLLDYSRALRVRNEALAQKAASFIERSHALIGRSHDIDRGVTLTNRACPSCGQALEFVETGAVDATDYDYYQWCDNRCGLYCFDRNVRQWVKLAG